MDPKTNIGEENQEKPMNDVSSDQNSILETEISEAVAQEASPQNAVMEIGDQLELPSQDLNVAQQEQEEVTDASAEMISGLVVRIKESLSNLEETAREDLQAEQVSPPTRSQQPLKDFYNICDEMESQLRSTIQNTTNSDNDLCTLPVKDVENDGRPTVNMTEDSAVASSSSSSSNTYKHFFAHYDEMEKKWCKPQSTESESEPFYPVEVLFQRSVPDMPEFGIEGPQINFINIREQPTTSAESGIEVSTESDDEQQSSDPSDGITFDQPELE